MPRSGFNPTGEASAERDAVWYIAEYEVFDLVRLLADAGYDTEAVKAAGHPDSAVNLMSPAALAALVQAQQEFAAATDRATARPLWRAARDAAVDDLRTHLLRLPAFTERRTPVVTSPAP